jgi:DNA-binding NarL/FixJ family response regulator
MNEKAMKIKIGIVDDHQLFSKSLGLLLTSSQNFELVIDAANGMELQNKLQQRIAVPDILLIDVVMPVMNGPQTARWMRNNYPQVRLAALSMSDSEEVIIEMLRSGCCAYFYKDTHPDNLEKALIEVYQTGYYNSDSQTANYRSVHRTPGEEALPPLAAREIQFLQFACSDLTYKDIASRMNVSKRTVDGYREVLFEKLKVQNRIGMVLEAIRRGIVKL